MLIVISAFLQKDDTRVVYILLFAHIIWAGHFYFMEIYPWLAIVAIGFFSLLISLKCKKNKNIFLFFVSLTLAAWFFTYKDDSSLLPIIASLLGTYWFFYLEKVQLRLVLFLCSSFWFSFHYLNYSIWWVINESVIQIIHLYAIYRFMRDEWKLQLVFLKIKSAFVNRPKIDYGRYLAVIDYISFKKK